MIQEKSNKAHEWFMALAPVQRERIRNRYSLKYSTLKITNEMLVEIYEKESAQASSTQKTWVCNECNTPNFTQSIPRHEIENELHTCIRCGGFEFHLENRKI